MLIANKMAARNDGVILYMKSTVGKYVRRVVCLFVIFHKITIPTGTM
jgi:hypothetical protein